MQLSSVVVYLVTGAAGFIGSNLVRAMNVIGIDDILAVDDLTRANKVGNLADCRFVDHLDKAELRRRVSSGRMPSVDFVFHQGACTDTTERRAEYLFDNNLAYSTELLEFALRNRTPFVYASSSAVYGRVRPNHALSEGPPIGSYADTKRAFDEQVRRVIPDVHSTVLGLRYFNTYGAGERHKGRMASMIYQIYRQLTDSGVVRLYEGTDGYAAGDQRRDFVHIDDVLRVNLAALEGRRQGIVDVGTGQSRSFNEAVHVLSLLLGPSKIEYVPLPAELSTSYQAFTEADLSGLSALGLPVPSTTLEDGVARSVPLWRQEDSAQLRLEGALLDR